MAVAALRELFSVGVTQLLQPPRGHGVPKQCEALVAVLDGHDHVQLQAPVEQEELVDFGATLEADRCWFPVRHWKSTDVKCGTEYIDKR